MKIKIMLSLSIVVLFFIILSQNSQVVTLKFLFWKVSMSQIVSITLFTLIGLLLGFLLGKKFK